MAKENGTRVQMKDFKLYLPVGWIRGNEPVEDLLAATPSNMLVYVDHKISDAPVPPSVILHAKDAPKGGLGMWPEAVPKWKHEEVGGLPCVRINDIAAPKGMTRFLVYANTDKKQYIIEFDIPGEHADWPLYAQSVLKTLSYTGKDKAIKPPAVSSADRRKRDPSDEKKKYRKVFANSPLYQHTLKTRFVVQSGVDPATENYVCVLNNGRDALLLRLHMIKNASRSIKMQTFIFSDDETGRLMMHELLEAAKRGVKVQLIADHIASTRNIDYIAFLATAHPNLEIRHYRPATQRLDPSRFQEAIDYIIPNGTNQRMHNKLLVVDDVIFITGGRNVENTYYNQSTGMNFKDRDVLVTGPVVAYASGSFEEYWNYEKTVPSLGLKDVAKVVKEGNFKHYKFSEDLRVGELWAGLEKDANDSKFIEEKFAKKLRKVNRALFLADKPGKQTRFFSLWGRSGISKQIATMMESAEKSIVLQSPYLILDGRTRRLLRKVRKKNPGLELRVSSNSYGSTDSIIAYSANFRLRSAYVEDVGLTVYEYKPHPRDLERVFPDYPALKMRSDELKKTDEDAESPFLCIHAKAFVVDGLVAYVGSFNLDPRSANINTEVGLLVEDPYFAAMIKKDIMTDMHPENSWVIAKRELPMNLDKVNRLVEGTFLRTPFDIWPIRNTTSYELKKDHPPVPPGHAKFYEYYDDSGNFPGAQNKSNTKEILMRISKAISGIVTPLM
jgi:putative cardiolipin synthase